MNRPFLIPVSVLLGLLAFCLWNANHMEQYTSQWQVQLQDVGRLAQQAHWDETVDRLSDIYADWCSHQKYLHTVSRHQDTDSAHAMYLRLIAYARTQDEAEFSAELAALCRQLRLLSDMERLRLENIL